MNLIEESYSRLFPETPFLYDTEIEYNRRLGNFNANISLYKNTITVKLNLQWKGIDDEIKIGLIQHLLLKILKKKQKSYNIDLYTNFIKQIPTLTPKTKCDTQLLESFTRVNEQFFGGGMEKPNLQWGRNSTRRLAHYNFHNDTVTMSTTFKDAPLHVVDYLMYHELLHKHHQFSHKNGRNSFHSPQFKRDEALYPNQKEVEKEIHMIARPKKRPKRTIWQYLRNI